MDRYILLGLLTIANVILIASAACPTTLCTCTPATVYTCNVKTDGISVANLQTILASANTDSATELTITKYLGTSLTSEMFMSAPKLTKLTIQDSPAVIAIEANTFKGLPGLTSLNILGMSMTTLPEVVFSPLKISLTGLMIINNAKLVSIPVKIFEGLTKLTTLELTDNPLTTLDASVFTGLTAIVDLTISKTSITTMPDTLFSPLKANLVKLLLIGNSKLATLPNIIFNGLTKLTKLELTDNPLTSFDASAFTGLAALVDLTISKTSITTMPETLFAPLKANRVKLLLIGNSKLATLPNNIFNGLTKLTKLELTDNPLTSLDASAFTGLTAMVDLTISKTSITTMPDTLFAPLKANLLKLLLIGNSKLATLPNNIFNGLTKLTKLELTDNPLTSLDASAFTGLTALVDLTISKTSITTMPETLFAPLKANLEQLLLTGNSKLAMLPEKIFLGLTKLTTLNLKDNAIKTFHAAMFNVIKKAAIDTTGNPVSCSCNRNIQDLIDFAIANTKLIIKCATPSSQVNKDLKSVKKADICPCPTTFCDCTESKYTCDKKAAGITEQELTTAILLTMWNTVNELVITNYQGATLKAETFKSAPTIKTLAITSSPAVTGINANAFKGMTSLSKLTISGTSVPTLPEGLFGPITATLVQLLITGNTKLAVLPDKVFFGLTKLTTLNLKDNAIKTFHAAMFNVIKKAAIDTTGNPVSCSCNRNIQDLIDFAIANTKLIIKCATPSSQVNKDLKSVKKADICPCPTTFCDCTESKYTCDKKAAGITEQELTTAILLTMWNTVNELVITNYQGATLKAETFKSTPTIKTLAIMSSIAVTEIDANAFKGMTSLSKLTILGTSVPTLPEGLFAPITATLVQLLITGNTKLAVLSNNVFVGLTKLTTLNLTNNAIRSFSAGLFNSVKQAKISASGNPVDCSCNSDISGLITWIKANLNVITTTIACDSPTLLKGKDLKTETMETVCPCPTTLCTCTGIKFTCDKVATGITETNLATAIIPKLTDFGGELKIVKYLGTTLKAEVFKSAPKIMKLSIDNSDALTTIDENAFKGMTALVALSISGTSVPTLPELVFSPIKGTLTELIIKSNTKLISLPKKTLTGLTKLTQLDLTDNAMVSFTASLFNDVKQATIKTAGNPVDCSCNDDITGLIKWLTENPTANLAIKCTSPDGAVKDKFLKSLTRVDVCGPPPSPQSTTIKPDKSMIGGLPDWALVIIVACIGAAIMVIVGIFCQRDKRKHYDEQKRIAYDNEHGYDNSAYVS